MTIHKGRFVSEWTEGTVHTHGTFNDDTGEVTAESIETPDLGSLEREYFEYKNQHQDCELEICTTCHSYIMKTRMTPDNVGNGLHEETFCSNNDCESNL